MIRTLGNSEDVSRRLEGGGTLGGTGGEKAIPEDPGSVSWAGVGASNQIFHGTM